MKNLIHKYSLTDQQWCDNRTIEDFEKEFSLPKSYRFSQRMIAQGNAYRTMVSGKVYESKDFLFALSKEAIEQYLKERE